MIICLYAFELALPAYIGIRGLNSQFDYSCTEYPATLPALFAVIVLITHLNKILCERILYIAKDIANKDGQPYGITTAMHMLRSRVTGIVQYIEAIPDHAWCKLDVESVTVLGPENFIQEKYELNGKVYTGVDFGLWARLDAKTGVITFGLSDGAPLDGRIIRQAQDDGFHDDPDLSTGHPTDANVNNWKDGFPEFKVEPNAQFRLGKTTCGRQMSEVFRVNAKDWHPWSVGVSRWLILARAAWKEFD
jgi:hypothetical protein